MDARDISLKKYYLIALFCIAILNIFAYFIVHTIIDRGNYFPNVINLSGRQRMLSQKIFKDVSKITIQKDLKTRTLFKDQLKKTMESWSNVHHGLQFGDFNLNLPEAQSNEIKELFKNINGHYEKVIENLKTIINFNDQELNQFSQSDPLFHKIIDETDNFLIWMDKIVFQFESEANERLNFLRKIVLYILISVLILLVLEALFIFRPMTRYIRDSINEIYEINRKKNIELERFVYLTSHDLRSPIANIQGFTQELQESWKDIENIILEAKDGGNFIQEIKPIIESEFKQAFHFIDVSIKKMNDLLDGLLKLAELGKNPVQIELLDMNKMLSNIKDSLNFQINEIGANVKFESLPELNADRIQINQVFSNLINNALKYLDNSRKGEIIISGEKKSQEIIYCVKDNGIGITQHDIKKIFEVFQRANPKSSVKGVGLGLSIVKHIIDRHHGRIWAESEYGKGSKFFIALPCNQ